MPQGVYNEWKRLKSLLNRRFDIKDLITENNNKIWKIKMEKAKRIREIFAKENKEMNRLGKQIKKMEAELPLIETELRSNIGRIKPKRNGGKKNGRS